MRRLSGTAADMSTDQTPSVDEILTFAQYGFYNLIVDAKIPRGQVRADLSGFSEIACHPDDEQSVRASLIVAQRRRVERRRKGGPGAAR